MDEEVLRETIEELKVVDIAEATISSLCYRVMDTERGSERGRESRDIRCC